MVSPENFLDKSPSNSGKKRRMKTVLLLIGFIVVNIHFAEAQQSAKIPLVGVLRGDSPPNPSVEAFQQALRDLGYLQGKNIIIEYRYAAGKIDLLSKLAEELVRLNVDVIWAVGPAVPHAKRATKTIPIVISNVGDPVGLGLVASLAKPGGHITGLTTLSPELSGKRLEVLKEVIPKLSRVAFFGNSNAPANAQVLRETELAAAPLELQIQYLDVQSAKEIEPAFKALSKGRAQAVLLQRNPLTANHHEQVQELAVKSRLPTLYADREFVEAGGLISYGADYIFMYRRVAHYVDKILKGTRPADLPIEQPTKFELVINLKTAKQIGLTIPPAVLARADKVIK
jgi:putative tryptophan/tyrosine transport system substrate-binding protein